MKATLNHGFTLWELLVAMLVAGILIGVGAPSFIEFQRNNAIASAANDLVSGVMAARTQAVNLQVPVTLCASPNPNDANASCSPSGAGTNGGFIVWVDSDGDIVVDAGETILLSRPAPGGTLNVFGDSGYVSFGPNGFPRDAPIGASATTILYCDERGNRTTAGDVSTARVVRIDRTGRGQVVREVGQVTPAVAALGAACP
jgi:type IV fimbrial biogenesis protein FimT